MDSKKKKIILIDDNKLSLPEGLIPNDVTQFLIEYLEDGRLILSPVSSSDQIPPDFQDASQGSEKMADLAEVIDIRLGRKRTKKTKAKNQQLDHEKKLKSARKSEEDTLFDDGFVRLHHFSSRLEAEMLGEILRQSDLPFLIQSEDIGIFGPGAAPAPGGAVLVVRRTDLEYAKTLLAGLI